MRKYEPWLVKFPTTPASVGAFFLSKESLDGWEDLGDREAVLLKQFHHWEERNVTVAGLFLSELVEAEIRLGNRAKALDLCRNLANRYGSNELGLAAIRNEMTILSAVPNGSVQIAARLNELSRQEKHPELAARTKASLAVQQIQGGRLDEGFRALDDIVLSAAPRWLDLKTLRRIVGVYRAHAERAGPAVMERLAKRYFAIYRDLLVSEAPLVLVRCGAGEGSVWYRFEVVSPFGLREEAIRVWRDAEKLQACDRCFKVGTEEHRRAKRNAVAVGPGARPADLLTSPCSDLAVLCYDDILNRIDRREEYESLVARFEALREKGATPGERHRATLFLAKAHAHAFDFDRGFALYRTVVSSGESDPLAARLAVRDLLDLCAVGGFDAPEAVSGAEKPSWEGRCLIEKELYRNALIRLHVQRGEQERVDELCADFRKEHGYASLEMTWAQTKASGAKNAKAAGAGPQTADVCGEMESSVGVILGESDAATRRAALRRFGQAASQLPAAASGAARQLLAAQILRHRGWDAELLFAVASEGAVESVGLEWAVAMQLASAKQRTRTRAWEAAVREADALRDMGRRAKAFAVLRGFVNRLYPEPSAVEFGPDSAVWFDARFRMASLRQGSALARKSVTSQESELLEVWPRKEDPNGLERLLPQIDWEPLRAEAVWRVANAREGGEPGRALSLYEDLLRRRPDSALLRRKVTDCRLRELAGQANRQISVLLGDDGKARPSSERALSALTERLTEAFVENTSSPAVLTLLGPLLWAYSAEGLQEQAALIVRTVLAEFPEEGRAWTALAGNTDVLLPVLVRAVEGGMISDEAVLAHFGEIALAAQAAGKRKPGSQGDLRRILAGLEERIEARDSEPERLAGLARLAEANRTCGDAARAIALYEKIAARARALQDADRFFHWSLVAADGLRGIAPVDRYLPIYRRLVQVHPGHPRAPDVQERVIAEYVGTGDFNSAAVECDRFVRLYPKHEQAGQYRYRGAENFYKGGMHDHCAMAIEKALRSRPANQPDFLLLKGLNLMAQNKDEEAIAAWKELDRRFPESAPNSRALFLQGYTHLTHQRYQEAKTVLDKLVVAFPESSYAKRAAELSEKIKRVIEAGGGGTGSGGESDANR